jgi:hypothetical protein
MIESTLRDADGVEQVVDCGRIIATAEEQVLGGIQDLGPPLVGFFHYSCHTKKYRPTVGLLSRASDYLGKDRESADRLIAITVSLESHARPSP